MFANDSFLTFSFPAGRLFGIPLRLSFLLPVTAVAVMWRLQDPMLGLLFGLLLLLSLLAHEIAHLVVMRSLDHSPGTIVLWPLGGIAASPQHPDFRGALSCALAGPAASLSIAAVTGIELHRLGQLVPLLNPLSGFDPAASTSVANSVLRAAFFINWCLGLINLLPVRPLDAGQVLLSFLNLRLSDPESRDLMLRLGLVLSLFGVLAGFVFDISGVVALSSFILLLHIQEATRWIPPAEPALQVARRHRNRSSGDADAPEFDSLRDAEDSTSSMLERWRGRREEEKLRREEEERRADEEQLDRILEKLHAQGPAALTSREVGLLNRVSARLRERNSQQS
jgi:Zn-dependent protease